MTNMISAKTAAVLAAKGADLGGRAAPAKPRRAGPHFRPAMAGGKPEIACRLAAVNHGKMNLRAMTAEAAAAAGNLAADKASASMASEAGGALAAVNAQNMAAVADSAADNGPLAAILAGIQQSLE